MSVLGAPIGAQPAPTQTVKVLYLEGGPNWLGTNLGIRSNAPGTVLRATDCSGAAGAYTLTLERGDLARVDRFGAGYLCSTPVTLADGTKIGVAKLPLVSGAASARTEAIYLDPAGTFNVVEIPELTAPLPGSIDPNLRYVYNFSEIEVGTDAVSGREKRTYLAVVTEDGRAATLRLTIGDSRGTTIATEQLEVAGGFAWYELKTSVRYGSVSITNVPTVAGPYIPPPGVFAAACVGFRDGGIARCMAPALWVSATIAGQ